MNVFSAIEANFLEEILKLAQESKLAQTLLDNWLSTNFNESEIMKFNEENYFSEYELFKRDKEQFINLNENFTLFRFKFNNFSFQNLMEDVEQFECLVTEKLEEALENLYENYQMTFIEEENLIFNKLTWTQTREDDCTFSFLIHLPWKDGIVDHHIGDYSFSVI